MIVLCGATCSGKTSAGDELEKLGYKKLVTYTSRPPRKNEVADKDYHFVTLEDFLTMYNDGFFAEARYYEVNGKVWWYGSAKEDYEKADDYTYVILNPDGLRKVLSLDLPNVVTFLIKASENVIRERQKLRGDTDDKLERRLKNDMRDFAGVDNIVDYVIVNDDITAKETACIVHTLRLEIENDRICRS